MNSKTQIPQKNKIMKKITLPKFDKIDPFSLPTQTPHDRRARWDSMDAPVNPYLKDFRGHAKRRASIGGAKSTLGIAALSEIGNISKNQSKQISHIKSTSNVATLSPFSLKSVKTINAINTINHVDNRNLSSFYITLKIESNYGHPEKIGFSEIDILDSKNHPIVITNVEFEPSKEIQMDDITFVNSSLIKESETQEFSDVWKGDLKIEFRVEAEVAPSNIRIWNSKETDGRCIKDVKIYSGDEFIAEATIPENFGQIISIHKMKSITGNKSAVSYMALRNNLIDEQAVDAFGNIPIKPTKQIKIVLMETFETTEFIGLESLEIFSFSGKSLQLESEISEIVTANVKPVSAISKLIRSRDNKLRSVGDMWTATKLEDSHDYPYLIIKLKYPIPIALIRIWNIPDSEYMPNFGVRKIKVLFDNIPMLMTKLKRGSENKNVKNSYWFTDITPIKMKIRMNHKTQKHNNDGI
ncbi:hypothetical protein TRFO_41154 [Tritrichomonas foetus]|uniref:KATNIP domain-containing protein n=1 Tax=Tritrichomonas foetus TaxID=1144522 RepID=A0A1J4L5P4_9EUKA|nr:hypothetical protein TRFO_41154 [Tritrichomonas foetus]|eukprot:OHT17270.1 hypothetical protein TRFO_41154 [Tritrichomonas foetus]